MDSTPHATIQERRARERRVWRLGLTLSILTHVLIFVLWPSSRLPVSPYAAAGPRSGDARPAQGGMQAMNLRGPPVRPDPPPPVPSPTLETVEPVVFDEQASLDPAQVLGERPGLEEPGTETGAGQGDGGTSDEGLYRLVPPSPRGMILPPANESLRGSEVSVWVFVDETGQVVPDSTRLEPPTGDRSFNRRLVEEASDWVFEPAREGGEPVAAWFPYTIRM